MKYHQDIHHRKSIRLKNFNYSTSAIYFITLCIHNRECVLGKIIEGRMHLSLVGECVKNEWLSLQDRFPNAILDIFVTMPNHFHGIIYLQENNKISLGNIIRSFKSISAIKANQVSNKSGAFWQRNYWDRIVRNEQELNGLREYIENNPLKWELDSLYKP